jgi:hypothetical protein
MPIKDSKKLTECIKKCEKNEKNEINLKIKNTKNDGNCFFSAIFRSLRDKNLLNDFYKCVDMVKSRTEVSFIKNIRKLIAENATDDIKNMFENLIIISKDKKTFKLVADSLGDMNEILYEYFEEDKYNNKYKNEFIQDVQMSIKENGNWVGQLEVDITINLFANCEFEENNLYIRVFNNYQTVKREIKKDKIQNIFDRTIYLLNQRESHYVYI